MSKPIDGGPAFPQRPFKTQAGDLDWPHGWGFGGMSLRDWFAGMALQGVLAEGNCKDEAGEGLSGYAYELADAMIARRNQVPS